MNYCLIGPVDGGSAKPEAVLDSAPIMKTIASIAAITVACSCATAAWGQYSWVGKDGRKVYSDQPPPAGISDKNVLQRPSAAAVARQTAAPAPAASANDQAPRPAKADDAKELAAKIKQADDAEAARKQAEQDRIARVKSDNCMRAQQAQATYASGVPLSHINAQGERVLLDESARMAETQRLGGIITSDCH